MTMHAFQDEIKSISGSVVIDEGTIVGTRAPSFSLKDGNGALISLADVLKRKPVLLAFYPSDFTMVCTKQLCSYRDALWDFNRLGLQIIGISQNTTERHQQFYAAYNFGFPLLSDPGNIVARRFQTTSRWMLGRVSRAVFILSRSGIIRYRYVEPTTLTRRTTTELMAALTDLDAKDLL